MLCFGVHLDRYPTAVRQVENFGNLARLSEKKKLLELDLFYAQHLFIQLRLIFKYDYQSIRVSSLTSQDLVRDIAAGTYIERSALGPNDDTDP